MRLVLLIYVTINDVASVIERTPDWLFLLTTKIAKVMI